MTLFSYHKYNDFILIQEIYTQKYTACTKDEANRIADNNLQSDGISYANGLAQADRCDCPQNWSAYASGSFNGQCLSISVSYDNPCGKSKTASFDVYYTRSEPSGDVEYFSTTKTVTIPSGSGTVSGGSDCVSNATSMYVSNPSQGGGC